MFGSRKTLYIPHNSLIIPLRVLAKCTFPVVIYFSNTEIDLYSFYGKNLITAHKTQEKTERSPYLFTGKQRFISLTSCLEKCRHFVYVHSLIMPKIMRSKDVECNTGPVIVRNQTKKIIAN